MAGLVMDFVASITFASLFQDEAFSLWEQHWGSLYTQNSPSRKVIEDICDTYCLVNLVDNDFPGENCLFKVIKACIDQVAKQSVSSYENNDRNATRGAEFMQTENMLSNTNESNSLEGFQSAEAIA